jgi:hypothetical protein
MGLQLSKMERETLLELIDNEMAWVREEETKCKDNLYKEKLHEEENLLTTLVQKLSREDSDLKEPVREDHDMLERTQSSHGQDF